MHFCVCFQCFQYYVYVTNALTLMLTHLEFTLSSVLESSLKLVITLSRYQFQPYFVLLSFQSLVYNNLFINRKLFVSLFRYLLERISMSFHLNVWKSFS